MDDKKTPKITKIMKDALLKKKFKKGLKLGDEQNNIK